MLYTGTAEDSYRGVWGYASESQIPSMFQSGACLQILNVIIHLKFIQHQAASVALEQIVQHQHLHVRLGGRNALLARQRLTSGTAVVVVVAGNRTEATAAAAARYVAGGAACGTGGGADAAVKVIVNFAELIYIVCVEKCRLLISFVSDVLEQGRG